MIAYQDILEKIESTIIRAGSANRPAGEIRSNLDAFKTRETYQFTDADYYWLLVCVVFYSGFRAATVNAKLDVIRRHFPNYETVASFDEIMADDIIDEHEMTQNRRKVQTHIENARVFKAIINEFGSFQAYIDSFSPLESFENLILLKEEIEYRFKGLGKITAFHFMMDIGLPVLKPDRVICRIFKRLGLIESEEQVFKTVILGRRFAEETGLPIRYIDIAFLVYGQVKSLEFGLSSGICLTNPLCSVCGITEYCRYYADHISQYKVE
jgi:DNA-3-methyladenine glycosylase I